jgi:predicted acetyltransferase
MYRQSNPHGSLLELYIHDFSELVPTDVGDDGRYGYQSLPLFGPITLDCHFWRDLTAN